MDDTTMRNGLRLSRRKFLLATSATALAAACGPATTTPSPTAAATAAATATPGKALKIGQLLPFTKVYAELGNSMKRSTELYLKQRGNPLANRPATAADEDWGDDARAGPV